MSRWLQGACIAFVLLSTLLLILVGGWYLPLQVDGGWYSYPSFGLSLGRDPYAHLLPVAEAARLDGLKALFRFDTTSSFRILYAAPWFRLIGAGFLSIKVLSLIEFTALMAIAYRMYASFFSRPGLVLFAMALILTDKSLILAAVSDFRPDLSLAAASCALYVMLQGKSSSRLQFLCTCFLAAVVSVIHITSIIPLSFVLAASAADAWLGDPSRRRYRLNRVTVVGVVAVLAYVGRESFFQWLLGGQIAIDNPVDPVGRMTEMWSAGPQALLGKEVFRWRDYFLMSNIALLGTLLVAAGLALARGRDGRRIPLKLRGPIVGLTVAMVVMAVLDPHQTGNHLVPLMPFGLLLLSKFEDIPAKLANGILGMLVVVSCILSVALGYRIAVAAEQNGVNNVWLRDMMASITSDDRPYIIAGPTELWPYMPQDKDIMLLDRTRTPEQFSAASGLRMDEVDYLIVNRDYMESGWGEFVAESVDNGRMRIVVNKPPFLIVAEMRSDGDSQPN